MATKNTARQTNPVDQLFDFVSEMLLELLWQLGKGVGLLVWWAVLFPMISLPVAGAVAAGWFHGEVWVFVVVGVSIAGMVLWRLWSPQTFERWLTGRIRFRALRWWRYTRRWDTLLTACNLTMPGSNDTILVPRIKDTQIGETIDRLAVKMLDGQCPDDYDNRLTKLAHAFGALECRSSIVGPGVMELAFRHGDSLAVPVAVPPHLGLRGKDAA
ncbi:hypothetical protein [Nocardia sp. NPDC051832]|uniref:hypothetical protein n=1 Tax=Nocardia sp. NPDC051832 TaxID=3155673 RepID=UPI003421D9E3